MRKEAHWCLMILQLSRAYSRAFWSLALKAILKDFDAATYSVTNGPEIVVRE